MVEGRAQDTGVENRTLDTSLKGVEDRALETSVIGRMTLNTSLEGRAQVTLVAERTQNTVVEDSGQDTGVDCRGHWWLGRLKTLWLRTVVRTKGWRTRL